MIKTLVLLCTLFGLSAAQQGLQVRHLILNEANLIETARGFAINDPSLLQLGWAAVSVNDGNAQIVGANCEQKSLSKEELLNSPQYQTLVNAKQSLYSVEPGQMPWTAANSYARRASIRYSPNGGSQISSMNLNNGPSIFNGNGMSITKFNGQDLTFSRNGLPNNINRIFVTNNLVTFVYNDGLVQMRPAVCLNQGEQQLVQQVRAEADQVEQNFRLSMNQFRQNMNQFQQNMNQLGQNMHQRMQKMNRDMSNMFQRNNMIQGQYQGYPGNNGIIQGQSMNGYGPAAPIFPAVPQFMNNGDWPLGPNNNPFDTPFFRPPTN